MLDNSKVVTEQSWRRKAPYSRESETQVDEAFEKLWSQAWDHKKGLFDPTQIYVESKTLEGYPSC
jgi:hypothetical protein